MDQAQLSRRGAVAAGVVLGACGLAGCGGETDEDATTGTTEMTLDASRVPEGGGLISAKERVVVTQPRKGEFRAFSSICTHQGCPVTSVGEDGIDCACHGSRFDLESGEPTAGPATEALPSRTVTESGGTLTIS